jgi:hypothetical protein
VIVAPSRKARIGTRQVVVHGSGPWGRPSTTMPQAPQMPLAAVAVEGHGRLAVPTSVSLSRSSASSSVISGLSPSTG